MSDIKNQFTFASPRPQYFSLPYPTMTYIIKASSKISKTSLMKLYQTCKVFFSKKKVVIVERAIVKEVVGCVGESGKNFQFSPFKFSCWFTEELNINGSYLSANKIYRSTIFSLSICHSTLTLEEFEFLVAENTIQNFICNHGSIRDATDALLPIDAVFRKLPNLIEFRYLVDEEKYEEKTLKALRRLKFSSKFKSMGFMLKNIANKNFNSNLIFDFIEKNGTGNAEIFFYLRPHIKKVFYKFYKNSLKKVTFYDC